MTTQTQQDLVPHVAIEVEVRFPVYVSVDRIREIGGQQVMDDLDETESAAREAIDENPDLLEEAFREYREGMGDYDVEDVTLADRVPVKTWRIIDRNDEGVDFYTEPAPNLRPGLMKLDTLEFVTESQLSKLGDEQIRGAHAVANMIWQTVPLGRREREQLLPVVSELHWIMLARPSLHRYEGDGAETCTLCNHESAIHRKAED